MLSPLPDHLVRPLTARFRTSLAQISATSAPKLRKLYEQLDEHNDAQVAGFTKSAQPIVTAAKKATVQQAAGYYALIAGIRPPSVQPADVDVEADLRGPFIQTWQAYSNGASNGDALGAGTNRAAAAIANFVASTSRLTGDEVYGQANVRVEIWLREPEGNACDWCLEAAQGTYTSAEATDFGHDNCMCIGVPSF